MTAALAALCALVPATAQEMPKSPAAAAAMEQADRLPITDFYSTPKSLAGTKPGALLRRESFAGYTLPAGATAVRQLDWIRSRFAGKPATSNCTAGAG